MPKEEKKRIKQNEKGGGNDNKQFGRKHQIGQKFGGMDSVMAELKAK